MAQWWVFALARPRRKNHAPVSTNAAAASLVHE